MEFSTLLVVICLLLTSECLQEIQGAMAIVKSFECTEGKDLCLNKICHTTTTRHKVTKINCGCTIPRPLYNLTVDLELLQNTKGKYFSMVKTKANVCEVQKGRLREQIIARVFDSIKSYIHNFKCPFYGNIGAKDLPFDLSFAPGVLVPARYSVKVVLANGKDLVMAVVLNFAVEKKEFRWAKKNNKNKPVSF